MKIYVISGGPSTGKTSVINELGKEFKILKEAARELGDKDSRFKGKSVKGLNMEKFQNAIFEFQKKQLEELKGKNEIVFSDRGLGDTLAYYKINKLKIPEGVIEYAKEFRCAGIFILEPLNFYEKDDFRQENREEQERIHNLIIKTYEELGYKPIIVPFMGVEKRVSFIKSFL